MERNVDLEADLDILSYCFVDQIKAKIEKRPPSEKLKKQMLEVMERVKAQIGEDEYIHFSMELCEDSFKEGKGARFANIKAVISKKDEAER